jgi:hypothetical protein
MLAGPGPSGTALAGLTVCASATMETQIPNSAPKANASENLCFKPITSPLPVVHAAERSAEPRIFLSSPDDLTPPISACTASCRRNSPFLVDEDGRGVAKGDGLAAAEHGGAAPDVHPFDRERDALHADLRPGGKTAGR